MTKTARRPRKFNADTIAECAAIQLEIDHETGERQMTRINWTECFVCDYSGQAFVAISDGLTTVCAVGGDLDAMIADYASMYGFNEPGDVSCVAKLYAGDEEASDTKYFTIHSDDGRRGALA